MTPESKPEADGRRLPIAIDRLRPEDKAAVHALYGRVFGEQALRDYSRRWEWQFERNPLRSADGPEIRVARIDGEIVGHYATIPVRMRLGERPLQADWGIDVVVDPRYQRQGIGSALFQYWHDHATVSMGLGLTSASHRFLKKLGWADVGPLPCYVKILSGRGLVVGRVPGWAEAVAAAIAQPLMQAFSGSHGTARGVELGAADRFDSSVDQLSEAVVGKFHLTVDRSASYLNWRFIEPPHVRYQILVATRGAALAGYLAYRVAQRNGLAIGLLVDWLTDPDDAETFGALVQAATERCREAGADKVRAYAIHTGFGKFLRQLRFARVPSSIQFCLRFNDLRVPPGYHQGTDRWHVTLGDSDQDR